MLWRIIIGLFLILALYEFCLAVFVEVGEKLKVRKGYIVKSGESLSTPRPTQVKLRTHSDRIRHFEILSGANLSKT